MISNLGAFRKAIRLLSSWGLVSLWLLSFTIQGIGIGLLMGVGYQLRAFLPGLSTALTLANTLTIAIFGATLFGVLVVVWVGLPWLSAPIDLILAERMIALLGEDHALARFSNWRYAGGRLAALRYSRPGAGLLLALLFSWVPFVGPPLGLGLLLRDRILHVRRMLAGVLSCPIDQVFGALEEVPETASFCRRALLAWLWFQPALVAGAAAVIAFELERDRRIDHLCAVVYRERHGPNL